ncbi:MAG: aminopeptidase P N-terminal domain-containing protein [Ignavibacteria bacterium]|nr:aminopeptidase P N-terminal domain-containing protein [Ignavibacteria bacterium]
MHYPKIESSHFVENRKRLAALLEPGSAAIINSNDIMPTNADGTMKFVQNSDLFYLSGILQEESVLLLYPQAIDEKSREILFIRDYNPELEVWEGKKLSPADATEISGVKTVQDLSKFESILADILCSVNNLYINSNEHDRADNIVETRELRFINYCRKRYPLHNYLRLAPLIYSLRVIKQKWEADLAQQACDLTESGFRRVLNFVKPGVYEYEIEAELSHEFIRRGSSFADYEPIIASGENSCFLHYIKNDCMCKEGDILLIDAAAGYSNYNADMTRTIPVSGKFSKRQREVYDAVLRTLRGTISEMKPGKTVKELQLVTRELIAKELVDLKLLKPADVKDISNKSPEFKKYYPHDVSHFLGLAVHDIGDFNVPMKAGMLLTCEPGIYIREEKLGVRLENNILITENGNTDLMSSIPLEAAEIEDIMNNR